MASEDDYERALHVELERRIGEISAYPDETFGVIRRADVIVIAIVCLALPAFLLWLFR